MPIHRSLQASKKQPTPHHLDFVCVGGRYRVGKMLGTGGSGEPHLNQVRFIFLSQFSREYLSGKRH